MPNVRLTAAQAFIKYLCAQYTEMDEGEAPYFAGAWAIFGHGNVSALGEALYGERERFATYRAHNEQTMAHAAIAYAKTRRRRQAFLCTSSIGPGATNMVTAAALAHVNRLPVLFAPGDVFASRRPDPVLQQIEAPHDATVSANDCFRPVSAYFDRITRPEQVLNALPRAMAVLTDPAACGPVTLAFCQDTQAEAFDYPHAFFEKQVWPLRRPGADPAELEELAVHLSRAERPLIIAGGGVRYSGAEETLAEFSQEHGVPVAETQAGKGALTAEHPFNLGAIGVTGSSAANEAAQKADLIIGLGTRLQDFTTGSRSLFAKKDQRLYQVNVTATDGRKHHATPVIGDVRRTLETLNAHLPDYTASQPWRKDVSSWRADWDETAAATMKDNGAALPSDAQVIGAVNRAASKNAIVVCAAGGLPGELHKLWRVGSSGGYHVEYGYSCMGYEIAGGLGVKMAEPDRDVYVMVGDGSYMMANSELATSIMLGLKLTVIVLDNRGFGCINRLQKSTGGAAFNNLLDDTVHETASDIDFARHASSLGAEATKVAGIGELEKALEEARSHDKTSVIVIDTDPAVSTEAGGHWWDVAVPETSLREEVKKARDAYEDKLKSLGKD
ncbi:3D-(3,5/4)-trihydroxycyclohexane-1,2-dione acylhydrolase (decyclizing) [Hyphococcus sp.]|uniref:3D-(3,5/4)-trihydroxycyclohexane-1,2-dione acylhydrolase (decyclizing) n=1 Tax=Hyphococcus sp. TaxID=2038636 RepID=UPI0035C78733